MKSILSIALHCVGCILCTCSVHALSLKEMIHSGGPTNTPPPVIAEISRSLLNPGETADLRLKINGASEATVPQSISASGLDIRLTGKSSETKTLLFKTSQSLICSYSVTPLRYGNFTIPSIPITVRGIEHHSSPISVAVPSSMGVDPKAPGSKSTSPSPSVAGDDKKPKEALLVANGAYLHFGKLSNPLPDARLLKASLERIGFRVVLLEDASREAILDGLAAFQDRVRSSGGAALFHFGGHGVQVNGKNYLIPVDANIPDEKKVATRAVDLDEVMTTMDGSGASVNIVVIDACRDNPLPKVASRAATRGLTVVQASPRNSVIIFAAEAGSKAEDGLFTPTLAELLAIPGKSLSQILKDVRRRVYEMSNGSQTPGAYDQLFEEVFLAGSAEDEIRYEKSPRSEAVFKPKPKMPDTQGAPDEPRTLSSRENQRAGIMGNIIKGAFAPPSLPEFASGASKRNN
jgi:hypothetical protein